MKQSRQSDKDNGKEGSIRTLGGADNGTQVEDIRAGQVITQEGKTDQDQEVNRPETRHIVNTK